MSKESVAVVVALTDPATPALRSRLARFADEARPLGEVLLVDASGSPEGKEAARGLANVRVISSPAGRLAPELWRDGLRATDAELVAFTTAQMIPGTGWLKALKDRLLTTNAAGVGGTIEPGRSLSTTDRAVALLRYSSYFPSRSLLEGLTSAWHTETLVPTLRVGMPSSTLCLSPADAERRRRHSHGGPWDRERTSGTEEGDNHDGMCATRAKTALVDPPGDNALYRRDRLTEVESAWINGFWEVEIYKSLRDRGETLTIAGSAVLTFEGGVGLGSMIRQRFRHGWRYGAGRSERQGPLARLARALAAPLVPPLLILRIVKSLRRRGMGLKPWISATPALILLATAWAIGEAMGTLIPSTWPDSQIQTRDSLTQLT
jgi:hypothetical protein